jgi:hypothetical protein
VGRGDGGCGFTDALLSAACGSKSSARRLCWLGPGEIPTWVARSRSQGRAIVAINVAEGRSSAVQFMAPAAYKP